MDGRKEAARRRFDAWGPSYERDLRSRRNAGAQAEALRALALEPGDRLLDVGCGSGAAVRAAAAVAERAVGVDLAPAMVARARELAGGLANAEFVVGDSEELPFPDGSSTAVLCTSSFHHYPDPARALAEIARVLAQGGRLVLADPNGDLRAVRVADRVLRRLDRSHVRLYPSRELAGLVAGAGFVDVTAVPARSRGYVIVSGRRAVAPDLGTGGPLSPPA